MPGTYIQPFQSDFNQAVAARLNADDAANTAGAVANAATMTAFESGDTANHSSRIVLNRIPTVIGDNASLANGAKIYTFPPGVIIVNSATMSAGLTLVTGTPTTDTPELGLGTLIGSGAVATLGDVGAGAENIAGPVVATNIAGAQMVATASPALIIAAGDSHDVFFNFADGWANVDNTAAVITGTVTLELVPVTDCIGNACGVNPA